MQLRPGEIVDGYRIQRPIGRGGMGAVYLAEHLSLRRPVALKIVTAALAEDPAFRERFEREARLAARLDHPNVVTVYDAGVHEAGPWLAMRYVDGQDLSRRLRTADGGHLAPEAAVRVVEQVAAGLDHAHAAGLVHRDVKPANVLIEDGPDGRALLADFGLTKEVDDAADDLTATGVVVGSVDYLAPERIAHGHVDGRADVYALAAMLWTLLTGRPPFDGQTATKLYRHVHAPRPEPSRLDPNLAGFDAVVARGMAIDPDRRYASAGDLAVAARAALEGRTPVVTERIVARGAAAPAPVDEAADGIVLHRRSADGSGGAAASGGAAGGGAAGGGAATGGARAGRRRPVSPADDRSAAETVDVRLTRPRLAGGGSEAQPRGAPPARVRPASESAPGARPRRPAPTPAAAGPGAPTGRGPAGPGAATGRVPPPVIRAAPARPMAPPAASAPLAAPPRSRRPAATIAVATAIGVVAVGGGVYLLARDDGGPDRSRATTSVARTTAKGGGGPTPAARRSAVAHDVARLMTLSADGRALTSSNPRAALANRRRVLRRLDALRPADDGQRAAIDAFRAAMRASISANQARIAGRPGTADAAATAAKGRFCDLWSSSGMAADARRSCDPGRI